MFCNADIQLREKNVHEYASTFLGQFIHSEFSNPPKRNEMNILDILWNRFFYDQSIKKYTTHKNETDCNLVAFHSK